MRNLAYSVVCQLGNEGCVDTVKGGKPRAKVSLREISCCFLVSDFLQPPSYQHKGCCSYLLARVSLGYVQCRRWLEMISSGLWALSSPNTDATEYFSQSVPTSLWIQIRNSCAHRPVTCGPCFRKIWFVLSQQPARGEEAYAVVTDCDRFSTQLASSDLKFDI